MNGIMCRGKLAGEQEHAMAATVPDTDRDQHQGREYQATDHKADDDSDGDGGDGDDGNEAWENKGQGGGGRGDGDAGSDGHGSQGRGRRATRRRPIRPSKRLERSRARKARRRHSFQQHRPLGHRTMHASTHDLGLLRQLVATAAFHFFSLHEHLQARLNQHPHEVHPEQGKHKPDTGSPHFSFSTQLSSLPQQQQWQQQLWQLQLRQQTMAHELQPVMQPQAMAPTPVAGCGVLQQPFLPPPAVAAPTTPSTTVSTSAADALTLCQPIAASAPAHPCFQTLPSPTPSTPHTSIFDTSPASSLGTAAAKPTTIPLSATQLPSITGDEAPEPTRDASAAASRSALTAQAVRQASCALTHDDATGGIDSAMFQRCLQPLVDCLAQLQSIVSSYHFARFKRESTSAGTIALVAAAIAYGQKDVCPTALVLRRANLLHLRKVNRDMILEARGVVACIPSPQAFMHLTLLSALVAAARTRQRQGQIISDAIKRALEKCSEDAVKQWLQYHHLGALANFHLRYAPSTERYQLHFEPAFANIWSELQKGRLLSVREEG